MIKQYLLKIFDCVKLGLQRKQWKEDLCLKWYHQQSKATEFCFCKSVKYTVDNSELIASEWPIVIVSKIWLLILPSNCKTFVNWLQELVLDQDNNFFLTSLSILFTW